MDGVKELKEAIDRAVVAEAEALEAFRDTTYWITPQTAMDKLAVALNDIGWRWKTISAVIDKAGL